MRKKPSSAMLAVLERRAPPPAPRPAARAGDASQTVQTSALCRPRRTRVDQGARALIGDELVHAVVRAREVEEQPWRSLQALFIVWLKSAGRRRLDDVLGLATAKNGRSCAWRFAQLEQQAHLRRAFDLVRASSSAAAGNFKLCEVLALELEQFESRQWPLWQAESAPPADASELQHALYQVFKAHAAKAPPRKAGSIYRALFTSRSGGAS